MLDAHVCPECGVPEPFYQGQLWLNNGDIVQSSNHATRMGFIECEALDPLFTNIGKIIGVSILPLVSNITARGTELYLNHLIPQQVKDMVQARTLGPKPFIDSITTFCQIIGYGKYEFVDYRFENDADDYSRMRIWKPFSVAEAADAFAGALSAVVAGEHAVSYEEISPGLFEFVSRWTDYPEVLKEKLRMHEYHRKDGDIELERCATCGSPKAFSECNWHLEKGIIVNGHTGRRMALLGYELLDSVFEALASELGETIPSVIVEAQRRFVKTGFYSIGEVGNESAFRTELALRGLGNVREIAIGVEGMHMRIDNVSCHLMTIGMAQALFEMALDVKSDVEWQLSSEGDLEVEVTPRKVIYEKGMQPCSSYFRLLLP